MGPNGRERWVSPAAGAKPDGQFDTPPGVSVPGDVSGHGDGLGGTVVRAGTPGDSAAVASLHAGQITDGFLSFLGPRFLSRLYRRICLVPGSFLVVAERSGRVVGFVAGSEDVGALYRSFLRRDGLHVVPGAGLRLLRRWRQVVETLRHGRGGDTDAGRGPELLAIAVDPAHRGRGLGSLLVARFLDQVMASGGVSAHVVVAAGNRTGVGLYERMGFGIAGEFELHAGTTSLVMQWDRRPPGPDAPADGGA